MRRGIVLDDHAGHRPEQPTGLLRGHRVAGLDVDGLGVAHEDRHPDRRARDPQIREVQDLAALRDELPLFLRVAVVQEHVDLGQGVERDLVGIHAVGLRLAGGVGANLALQLGDRLGAGAGHGLVGVDDHALDADAVAQRHEHRHELHRRAVRVGDDALVGLEVVRVDLAHDERDGGIHAPRGRVVDDDRAARGGLGCEVARDVGAGAEQRDVDPVECLADGLLDLDRLAAHVDGPAGRPAGGEEPQLGDRKAALAEHLHHRPTDDAGGADDGNREGCRLAHPGMAPQGFRFIRARPGV